MNTTLKHLFAVLVIVWTSAVGMAQVNTGSTGSDGALDFSGIAYSTNIVINMADHPNGVYQYTSVNIPTNVTVMFIPNAKNTPVTWLVQNNATINGTVDVSGQSANGSQGGSGGVGGFQGGYGGAAATSGQGLGGGIAASNFAGNASYGSQGATSNGGISSGSTYGNTFLIPLLGGAGGGGSIPGWAGSSGGGGGGGAILIASSNTIMLGGTIKANGGSGASVIEYGSSPPETLYSGGGGSGGAIRLVASRISGVGSVAANGGEGGCIIAYGGDLYAGSGRVRFDTYQSDFGGSISGNFTEGSQYVIIPLAGQLPQLTISTVGGIFVSASPTGVLSTPDAILSPEKNNPIPIIVNCANLPVNTSITVSVKPANHSAVSATGLNNIGTLSSSTATILITIPRGGGLIYATAATGN